MRLERGRTTLALRATRIKGAEVADIYRLSLRRISPE
jgi:hypothetical protein